MNYTTSCASGYLVIASVISLFTTTCGFTPISDFVVLTSFSTYFVVPRLMVASMIYLLLLLEWFPFVFFFLS